MNRKIILWILVILWMGLIFYFSSFNGVKSTEQSQGFLSHTVLLEGKDDLIQALDPIVRKTAHIGVYFVLGILVSLALNEYNLDIKKFIIMAFLICFLYSISDEIHQLFVSGRSAELKDVLIDSGGSLIGIIVYKGLKNK